MFLAKQALSPLLGPEQVLPWPNFLKAEHTEPVCASRFKETAKGRLFVRGRGWSLVSHMLTCQDSMIRHNEG